MTAKPLRASTTSIRGVFVDNSMRLVYDCFLVNIRFTHIPADTFDDVFHGRLLVRRFHPPVNHLSCKAQFSGKFRQVIPCIEISGA